MFTSTTPTPAAEVIDQYHARLRAEWGVVAAAVTDASNARGLTFLGRPVLRALRPAFIDDAAYRDIAGAATLIGGAIDTLAVAIRADARLRDRLRLSETDEFLVQSERDPRPLFARLDGFVGTDGVIRFVEFNPNPFGAIFTDVAGDVFSELPIVAELNRTFRWRRESTQTALIETIGAVQRRRGRSGRAMPNVAVVTSASGAARMTETEGYHLVRLAAAAGADVRMVSPEAVRRENGELVADGFTIDCLTFGDNAGFLEQFPPGHEVWTALANGEVWMFGSLAVMALHGNKTLFALLSTGEVSHLFDGPTNDAIRRHIPWTRVVAPGITDFHGEAVELFELIAGNRDAFVLKPAQAFGGADVTLGWHADADTWNAALERARHSPHVVQERVHVPSEAFPFVNDDGLSIATRRADFNPYLWSDGRVQGALIRVSDSDMLNITLGTGTLAPLFIVEGRA